ncbi:MAG TPA: DUF427 domain-containing protein [Gammaproteobacteria bacterium]|nr:DUF427 domain-containing protein [Gammaproteobacteria bacterium]
MYQAVWNDRVLAESEDCLIVENNYYFPPASIREEYFRPSDTHTLCSWKGEASYYDIVVDGEVNRDAAWYYPSPEEKANHIRDYVAFWNGVEVLDN